ncbi:coiled-coil domain-containing protein 137-like isoform X2 [Lampetra planeri]
MGRYKDRSVDTSHSGPKKDIINKGGCGKKTRAPRFVDEQGIPAKLREIMENQRRMKDKRHNRNKHDARVGLMGTHVEAGAQPTRGTAVTGEPAVPRFRRRRGESESTFVWRMNCAAEQVRDVCRAMPDRQPEVNVKMDKRGRVVEGGGGSGSGGGDEGVKISVKSEAKLRYNQKKLGKFVNKRRKKQEKLQEMAKYTDPVRFGEVVMEPPSLTAKPRKCPAQSKAGEKKLLLRSLMVPTEGPSGASGSGGAGGAGGAGGTVAPKPSMARQRIVEEERERVVRAYRHLKAQKEAGRGPQHAVTRADLWRPLVALHAVTRADLWRPLVALHAVTRADLWRPLVALHVVTRADLWRPLVALHAVTRADLWRPLVAVSGVGGGRGRRTGA